MTNKPSDFERLAGGAASRAGSSAYFGGPAHKATLKSIQALLQQGRFSEAYEEAKAFLSKNKRDPRAHLLMALICERRHDPVSVRSHALKALQGATEGDACMVLARLERMAGDTDTALEWIGRATRQSPGNARFLIQLAGTLEEAGRFTEARAVVDPMIARFEQEGSAIPAPLRCELAKLLVQERSYSRAVEVIDELLGEHSTPREMARMLYYLKAKACDRSGLFDNAFEAAGLGNKIGLLEFDPELYDEQVTTLIETWSAERFGRFPRSGCEDEMPVFIAGMPRSGTSLIDQIIDAHPMASGVGEMSTIERFAAQLSQVYDPEADPGECFGRFKASKMTLIANEYARAVRKLAPNDSLRVVNKALGNNKLVGLIALLFPKTRIIHAMRDPRDVAISCYMGGFNNRLHAWTTKIEWASCAWEQSQRMMEHWKSALDVPILDVQYEELVREPGTQFPRLIEFLGLEWDEACKDFYKSKRTVRTLSYDQVNRPLYTTSAGRNANYATHIKDVGFPAYPA